MNQEITKKPQLLRKMNLLDSTFLVIGAVVGSGIFMTTGFIAGYLPNPGFILVVWLVGGFIALCGALSFAELGAMYPRSGGQYVYLRESYGPLAGFLYGWGFFWIIDCGGIAALAVGFAEYLGYFIPFLSTKTYILKLNVFNIDYSLSTGQLVAVVCILVLSSINYFGIKGGIAVQNLFTFLKLASLAAIVVFGLAVGKKSGVVNLNQLFSGDHVFNLDLLKLFGLALIAVIWTYDGFYSINCTAGEVKKPEKNIPLGLLIGTLSVTAIYCLVNLVYVMALPVEKMKGVARIGELASTQLFGSTTTLFIAGTIMISIFGCLSASILYGPRVFFAMAEDRSFFQSMAHVHPRYHVPSKAIIGQALWSALLCLSGTYQDLFEYVVFALVIFFAATGFSVIILRLRKPERKRPYKTWGYPFVPIIFVLINLAIFFNTIWAQPLKSMVGLLILCIGIPAFFYWKAKGTR